MNDATGSTIQFSWKAFVIGFPVNSAGVMLLEVLQYVFGAISFTDDVSASLIAIEIAYWIWSPVPIFFGLAGATLAEIPSIVFLFISGLTMATVAGFVVPLLTQGRGIGDGQTE